MSFNDRIRALVDAGNVAELEHIAGRSPALRRQLEPAILSARRVRVVEDHRAELVNRYHEMLARQEARRGRSSSR